MRSPALALGVTLALLLAGCTTPAAEAPSPSPSPTVPTAEGVEGTGDAAAFPCLRAFLGTSYESEATYDAIVDVGELVKPEGIRGPPTVPRDTRVVAVRLQLDQEEIEQEEPGFWDAMLGVDSFPGAPFVEARLSSGNWTLSSGGMREAGLTDARASIVAFVANVTGANASEASAIVDALVADRDGADAGPVPMLPVTTERLEEMFPKEKDRFYTGGGSFSRYGESQTRFEEAHLVGSYELRYREPLARHTHRGFGTWVTLTANEDGEVALEAQFSSDVAPKGRDPDELIRLVASDLEPLEITELDRRGILDLRWGETPCGSEKVSRYVDIELGLDECAARATTTVDAAAAYDAIPEDGFIRIVTGIPAPQRLGAPAGGRLVSIANGTEDVYLSLDTWWGDAWSFEVSAQDVPPERVLEEARAFLALVTAASPTELDDAIEALEAELATPYGAQGYVSIDGPAPDPAVLDQLLLTLGDPTRSEGSDTTLLVEYLALEEPAGSDGTQFVSTFREPIWGFKVDVPARTMTKDVPGGTIGLVASAFGDVDVTLAQEEPASIARDETGLRDALRTQVLALGLPGLDEAALAGARITVRCDDRY